MSWIYLTELMKVGKWMWFHLFKPIPTERAELWLKGELLSPSYGNVLPWCSWALRTWRSQSNPMSKSVWTRRGLLGNVVDGWTGWSQRSFPAFTIPWLRDSALGCVRPYLFVFPDNLFGQVLSKSRAGRSLIKERTALWKDLCANILVLKWKLSRSFLGS